MIGHINGADLNLENFEKRKCVISTQHLIKSIKKHYADEFGSPSKWLAIAKKCGVLGAVSVLTGAVDGVSSFGKGLVSTAKTGDVTKLVGGTASLVTKTVGGVGDGISSVLKSVETGLQHVGGDNTSQRDDDSPDNVVVGVVDGVKGIGGALVGGVTGFYTKNKKELDKSDGSVLGGVAAVTKGTARYFLSFAHIF
jgi:hypothetical protein